MKVLFVITGLGIGGAECQVVSLADRLAIAGDDVLILVLTGEVVVKPEIFSVKIEKLRMKKNLASAAIAFYKAIRIVKAYCPEVVHSHMVHANIFARLLRLFCPVSRLVCTAHSTNEGGRFWMLCYQITDSLADISTNVSSEAVKIFVEKRAAPAGRIVPVMNGVDVDKFSFKPAVRELIRDSLGVAGQQNIILAVGRLEPAKDYPSLLHAFSMLQSFGALLWIVGEGSERLRIENLAAEFGIQKFVRFLGARRDVPDLMSVADVFVLSSAWEGFGLVVAEAMACERLVVATDCGGVREVIGDVGELVPPRDSAALAAAIDRALCLSEQETIDRQRLGRERVERLFSLDVAVEKWREVYQCGAP